MQNETAFELEVDIIKDYGDVRKDIQDVVSVIERDDNYEEIIQKVFTISNVEYLNSFLTAKIFL